MKLLLKIILLVVAVAGILICLPFFQASLIGSEAAGPAVEVVIPAGTDVGKIASMLEERGVIGSAWQYRVYARLDARAAHPLQGTYHLRPGASYHAIARVLATMPVRAESSLTIVEGWTADMEAQFLLQEKNIAPTSTSALTGQSVDRAPFDLTYRAHYSFLNQLPADRSLDGYLFPNTYRVWDDELPAGLIQKQLDEFAKRFDDVHVTAASAPLKTLDDVVILASIVEKEVSNPSDRKIVAGIFLRRLREGMALQSDATVNYALGKSTTRPTNDDISSASKYNTYKYPGLPPGPICNPAESAIQAVLDPAPTSYRYFLTDQDGKVLYAKTFEDHIKNRQRAGYSQ